MTDVPEGADAERRPMIGSRMIGRRIRARLFAGCLALLVVALAPVDAVAAEGTVARWEMDESPGSTVMVDSSGNGRIGNVGPETVVGSRELGEVAYRWRFTPPDSGPVVRERLVVVPDHPDLDPGAGDFGVTLRYRTTSTVGNLLQKGQSGTAGGFWKIENRDGRISCLLRGRVAGGWNTRAVTSPRALNDGAWHTVTCRRRAGTLRLSVDGSVVATATGSTGVVDNDSDMPIGGKLSCDQDTVGCDYFTGAIARVEVFGAGGPDPAGPATPWEGTFRDDDDSPFQSDIERIAAAEITLGCNPPDNDRFCPSRGVTRSQMAAFLTRALDLPPARERFRDVSSDDTFAGDIGAIAAAGITRGCNPPENDRFCPDQTVRREQMAAFLARALGLPAARERFRDVSSRSVFAADIGAIAAAGVTRGCNPPDNDRFCPRRDVTRGQMAAFMVRAGLTD